MNANPGHLSLYQINTRVWLTGLSEFSWTTYRMLSSIALPGWDSTGSGF
jgi:hypothetical protein